MAFEDVEREFGESNPEGVEQARQYREHVKAALVEVLSNIPGAITEQDGRDYVNVEVITGLTGVFAERGMQATMRGALLGDQRADGAAAVYSEASTVLDVLACIVKGVSVT